MADETALTMSAKRSFSDVQNTCVRRPKEDLVPYKKKRTKLVDLFHRASMATNPDECTKVYLRVKPFTEDEDSSQKCLKIIAEENAVQAMAPDCSHAHKNSTRGQGKSSLKFTFSQIFDQDTTQTQFFNATMLEMTKEFIGGQNSLIFSYGVTSSGKTHTIQGKPQDAGILPRSLDVLFNSINGKQISNPSLKPEMFNDFVRLSDHEVLEEKKMKKQTLKLGANDDPTVMSLMGDEMESVLSDTAMSSSSGIDELLEDVVNRDRERVKVDVDEKMKFGVWVSFVEVYNEQVYDLLVPVPQKKKAKRQTLRISEDRNGNPYIKGLKEIHVESADEAYKLLTIGQRNLMTACTRLNHCSSRSHSIFTIKILRVVDKDNPHIACVSTLSLCDLAGSERYSKTQASGDRLREAGNINTSLMTLGRCIETLRHNQLHRDQQRLVPFRDSKLTRILQNFFNGCGKAAMIVNVSQAASMFDDTLHVFKFSAIAKEVKYEKPPEEKKIQRVKKPLPPLHRQTLVWESQEILEEALNTPLPNNDDDLAEEDEEELNESETLRKYIEVLEDRNKSLYEMLADEIRNAQSIESRVKKEAYESMQKQMVIIEESYSSMLRDTNEEAEELADERARGIMEVYEKRLERIQIKVDEEDEWVSSMLYYQEKMKVEEKEAKIAELQKKLEEKKTVDDSVDMGNSVLVETLTHKLQKATEEIAKKDAEVNELKLLVEEAGETYTNHIKEIKILNEGLAKEQKTVQQMSLKISDLEKLVNETKKDAGKSREILNTKESEWLASEQELLKQLKSKDSALSSLEEECKELQGEIEQLQDKMSQIDENSRCQRDLDSSLMSEKSLKLKQNLSIIENSLSGEPKLKIGKENICDVVPKVGKENSQLADDLINIKNELESKEKDIIALKIHYDKLESTHSSTLKETEAMSKELQTCKERLQKAMQELGSNKDTSEKSFNDLNEAKEQLIKMQNDLTQMQEQNEQLTKENQSLKTALADAKKELKEAEDKYETVVHSDNGMRGATEITHMVKVIEERISPQKTPGKSLTEEDEDEDEIVLNIKTSSKDLSSTTKQVDSQKPETDLVLKLKDAELANIALRNKLKHEEDDYFKREQALIHGYTAEIDSLKHELAKFKTKADGTSSGKLQRGKKRALVDISTCSSVSESYCEVLEEKDLGHPRINSVLENPDKTPGVDILSNEVAFLREQLVSLTAAHRLIAKQDKSGEHISIKQGLEPVTKAVRLSEVSTVPRYSLTNSVLLFEKEEYTLKFEEMSSRAVQLENEIKSLTDKLEKEREKSKETQDNQGMIGENNKELDIDLSKSREQIQVLTKEIADAHERNGQIQQSLHATIADKDKLECKYKEKEKVISNLEESLNVLKNNLENAAEQNNLSCQNLNSEIENLSQKLAEVTSERDVLAKDVQGYKNQLTSMSAQIEATREEKCSLEQEIKEMAKQLEMVQTKICQAEQNYKKIKQDLETKDSQNNVLDKRFKDLEQCLHEKEKSLKKTEEEYRQLEQQLNSDCKTKSSALSSMQDELCKISSQLKEKSEQLARLESLRQEEAAEVAQKLIMLERQRKVSERKLLEACEREEEEKLKLKGYDALKQDLQKLQEELKTANLRINEEQALNKQLHENLASVTEEVKQLRKSATAMASREEEAESLKSKLLELQQSLESVSKSKNRAVTEYEELLQKVEELSVELLESEKTMDQQEQALTKQDEEIKNLKSEPMSGFCVAVRKFEEEVVTLRQSEHKLLEAEHRDKVTHEKLLESSSTNGALQTKVEELEKEKLSLERSIERKKEELIEEKEKLNQSQLQLKEKESENERLTEKAKLLSEELKVSLEKAELQLKEQDCDNKRLNKKMVFLSEELQKSQEKAELQQKEQEYENKELTKKMKLLNEELTLAKSEKKQTETQMHDLKYELEHLQNKDIEKDLEKQRSINKRNKEEMENWKAERDLCVKQLEQCISKLNREKDTLTEEVEKLKKSNADLAQEAYNIGQRKDALISELKKSNNTMSIQLADAEGKTPPPKMATPELPFPGVLTFEEDINTSGHSEVDVTPMAARKGKKRQKSLRSQPSSSSVDPEPKNYQLATKERNLQYNHRLIQQPTRHPLKRHLPCPQDALLG
ncbi:kinesin-like protein [Elysia marginata]|uniref:Kinesin-like protein n=1 Tax=Elysia marginata TaxID=1093978 RepID=A0AAV4EGC3_9GAST|nr:kinesin-like protein [Elysia marginata]